jgi:hypothetical protein
MEMATVVFRYLFLVVFHGIIAPPGFQTTAHEIRQCPHTRAQAT